MANINDHKYVKLQSKNIYKYIPNMPKSLENEKQEIIGFYHYVLEKITGVQDANDIQELIQDQEYVGLYNGIVENDLGIDAVYINTESNPEKEIMIFNFKYCKTFKPEQTPSENDIATSLKFFQYIKPTNMISANINKNSKVYNNIQKIRECLNSDDIYKVTLYMITNKPNGYAQQADEMVQAFIQNYDMSIVDINLDDIISYADIKKEKSSCKMIFSANDLINYKIDEKSTEVSYITKIPLLDLIRITCNNTEFRMKQNLEDSDMVNFQDVNLQYSLLYDNVRGYLGNTTYNKNIYKTIHNTPKEFFMFNNGITITSENIKCEKINFAEKYLLELNDFQIVNGGQTLRSAYNYFINNTSENKYEKLKQSQVLIRVFKINTNQDFLKNNIAEYTNSQNAISSTDLKSINPIQIEIERHLEVENILYIRKAGDVGNEEKRYDYRISMEKFTQILYSSKGYPERVSNVKKRLFSTYYEEIYSDFDINKAKELIILYNDVEDFYKENKINKYSQKMFYIIFIVLKYNINIYTSNKYLSEVLKNEQQNISLSESRILLKKDFKIKLCEYINEKLNIKDVN